MKIKMLDLLDNDNTLSSTKAKAKFTQEQLDAIKTNYNRVIVSACAGSGKTSVLTGRVRYLLLNKLTYPENIVCITFTNAAANEMRSRLNDIPGIDRCFIGTIHSFANMLLKEMNCDKKLFTDSDEETYIIDIINTECRYATIHDYFKLKQYCYANNLDILDLYYIDDYGNAIDKYKHHRETLLNDTKHFKPYVIKELLTVLDVCEFDDLPKSNYKVTMDSYFIANKHIALCELIPLCSKFIGSNDGRFIDHLLVDEFQDVGNEEFNFIMSIKANNKFLIGDELQAIYGFKGSNSIYFSQLIQDNEWKNYRLSDNFRNDKMILTYANTIASCIKTSAKNKSYCNSDSMGKVIHKAKSDLPKSLDVLFKDVKDYNNWFCLGRSNKDVSDMLNLLKNHGIPAETFKISQTSHSMITIDQLMKNNTVKVLTVHTAKGLEADNVIMVGCFDNNLTKYNIPTDKEELRVYYVGVTRARHNLYVFNSTK